MQEAALLWKTAVPQVLVEAVVPVEVRPWYTFSRTLYEPTKLGKAQKPSATTFSGPSPGMYSFPRTVLLKVARGKKRTGQTNSCIITQSKPLSTKVNSPDSFAVQKERCHTTTVAPVSGHVLAPTGAEFLVQGDGRIKVHVAGHIALVS